MTDIKSWKYLLMLLILKVSREDVITSSFAPKSGKIISLDLMDFRKKQRISGTVLLVATLFTVKKSERQYVYIRTHTELFLLCET